MSTATTTTSRTTKLPPPPRPPAVSLTGGIGLTWETLLILAAVGAGYYELVVKPRTTVTTVTTTPKTGSGLTGAG